MKRLTLSRFFALATLAVAVVIAVAMALLVRRARHTVLEESGKLQQAAALRIEDAVAKELARAGRAIDDLERGIVAGAISAQDAGALEAPLLIRLLADQHLEELAFTRAQLLRYTDDGSAVLAPQGRFQLGVLRDGSGALSTRLVAPEGAGFALSVRQHPRGLGTPLPRDALPDAAPAGAPDTPAAAAAPLRPAGPATDPTEDLTFSVIAERSLRGQLVWSDLHYAEADRALPPDQRRIVLTAQKAIFDAQGRFLGILRCGLLTRTLDAVAQLKVDAQSADPQRVAVLARTGRGVLSLVTRVSADDRIAPVENDLRVVPTRLPAELAALMTSPLAAALDGGAERIDGTLDAGGTRWRATLSHMPAAIGGIATWTVAVLVAEEHYTRAVAAAQRELLLALAATLGLLVTVGGVALMVVRRDLAKLIATTARMRAFDFAAGADASPFADVNDAMAGLERAKTVVRAMGRYLPIDLVRQLYADNAEPALGGQPLEVSILFTDIEGFTQLSERLPVGDLARRLGDYLEVMTHAIEAHGGTIDKYIGDAVMALWNAPSPVPAHPVAACRAVLACLRATEELYTSPRWAGLPPLTTRFGLHQSRVLVGHFGSPTRLSYTALGDGVNLAARLEPLCKQYGVRVLVSEDIAAAARAELAFRRIDRVAVKGKSQGVDIFELLGEAGPDGAPADPCHAAYEAAFTAYLARDFAAAAALLAPAADRDPPSAVLRARCQDLLAAPPPADWNGVHIARSK